MTDTLPPCAVLSATRTIFQGPCGRQRWTCAGAGADGLGTKTSGAQKRKGAKTLLGYRHHSSLERAAFSTTSGVTATGELLST
jgi:hypothetical protein